MAKTKNCACQFYKKDLFNSLNEMGTDKDQAGLLLAAGAWRPGGPASDADRLAT
jgi:hypothetical protein